MMLGCCLLATAEALGAGRCEAKPQKQHANAHLSASKHAATENVARPVFPPPPPVKPMSSPNDYDNSLGFHFLKNIAFDQRAIWTSPAHIRVRDASWLVPFGGFTAGLMATDRDTSLHLSHNPTTLNRYDNLSNYMLGSLVAGGGGLYLWGHISHNDHEREAGLLSGEAAIDTLGVTTAIKYAMGRDRPFQENHDGNFWSGGDSFPSDHAATAWSIASVLAHEYPGPLTQIFAYGAATAVSMARVRAQQHFTSDVAVGAAIGWLIGWQVYRAHHNPDLGGGTWPSLTKTLLGDRPYQAKDMGSPYVPLDSWIYPAFDRLAALGVINTEFAGMRPWTRIECTRLLDEASDRLEADGAGDTQAEEIYRALEREFQGDVESISNGGNSRVHVESIYSRIIDISGQPLVDGNHFGQTLVNDFGRPYQEGFNTVDGLSAWATSGPFVGYVRAEYQHAPFAPPLPATARDFIATVDLIPGVPPATPYLTVNQLQVLDAYVGMKLWNWQITFGRQSLWWSPMQSGPLMFSDNAVAVNMFRVNRVSPLKLPWIFGWLGPMRFEWFLGQLAGHEFVRQTDTGIVGQFGRPIGRQPFLQGQKLSFKPTPNFEFSVDTTTVFAGGPTPLTLKTFFRSYSIGNGPTTIQGGPGDPGDRRSGVDFSYRIPGLRNWVTFYGDAMTEDEFSPLAYPHKSAFEGGLYFPRIPGVPKLDLRLEGGTTAPYDFHGCTGCFYVNNRYPDGSYVNDGNIVGSWLGRAGQGERVWSTYWFSPRSSIQLQYRHQKVDKDYLPGGGTLNDGGVILNLQVSPNLTFSGSVQYEKWDYPLLAPTARSNWVSSIGLTFWPGSHSLGAQ